MADQQFQYVELPDGSYAQFDASMPKQAIAAALQSRQAAAPEKPARTWTDTAVDALPAIGGTVGGIVGGIGGTVGGMGVGGVPGAIGGAALGGGAGEAARELVNDWRGKPTTSSADAALNIIQQGGLQGGAQAVGGAIGAVAKPMAEVLMQSALKPGLGFALKAVRAGKSIPVVKTLLDEGVNVSESGIAKLQAILDASNQQVKDAIANIPFDVNPFAVTKRLGPVAQRAATQVNPEADMHMVSEAGREFLRNNVGPIPGQAAQELKQGTYRSLGKKAFGEMKGTETEAQKALARGLKEEIETEVGKRGVNISAPNARAGRAQEAMDAVSRRVAVGGNANPGGLATLAVSHPTTFISMLLDKSPAVKSMLARGLYQSAGIATGVSPVAIRAAVQALVSSKDDASDE